jgi:hypothetical protein
MRSQAAITGKSVHGTKLSYVADAMESIRAEKKENASRRITRGSQDCPVCECMTAQPQWWCMLTGYRWFTTFGHGAKPPTMHEVRNAQLQHCTGAAEEHPAFAMPLSAAEESNKCAASGGQRGVVTSSLGVHEAGEESASIRIAVHYDNYACKATTKEATPGAREKP